MKRTVYQLGEVGHAPDHKAFFQFPALTLREVKEIIADSFGGDFSQSIAVGAVMNDQRELLGELVMVGGERPYCVGRKGERRPLTDEDKIAFLQLAHFQPHKETLTLTAQNLQELEDKLAKHLKERHMETAAVKITAQLPSVTFRSLNTEGAQITPDCCLAGVCEKHQKKFEGTDMTCRLSGFFCAQGAVQEGTSFDNHARADGTHAPHMLHLHGEGRNAAGQNAAGHLLDFSGPATFTLELMPDIEQWLVTTREQASAKEGPKWTDRIRTHTTPTALAKA